jgi:hypothetical protein
MKKTSFGFVTACHRGDKFMVQATLASMRHFCPHIPICLLADGDVEVDDLQKEYDLIVMRPLDLPNKEMAQLVSGNYRIKLAAMWEGPFEHYVWIDSDAIVWGDFTAQVRLDVDFQIFWSEISIPCDAVCVPAWLPHFYFDLDRLLEHDPTFEWRGWPYFSAGVYACRKNFISYDEWMSAESWNVSKADPVFKFGDQGLLNYLVHSSKQRGVKRVEYTDLQYKPGYHGRSEIDSDTVGCRWSWPKTIARPRVAHFSGQKPLILNQRGYSHAFTIARLEHQRRNHSELTSWSNIILEELPVYKNKFFNRASKILGLK